MWKSALAVILILLPGLVLPLRMPAAPPRLARPAHDLWIDVAMGRPLVEWFNQIARPEDIARVDIREVELLDHITAGCKLVVFKSVAEAEEFVPRLASTIDIVGYNLEHGPMYSEEDQDDSVGSVRRMRALARQYNLPLAVGPDRGFALSHGAAMAPYVDLFMLQVQRVQREPETVRGYVAPLVAALRRANPRLLVSVQVRTEGRPEAIAGLVESLREQIDGVSILTSPETVDLARALVSELRSSAPEAPISPPPPVLDEEGPPAQMEQSLPRIPVPTAPHPRATSATPAAPPATRLAPARLEGFAPLAGGLLAGMIAEGLAVHLISRRRRRVKG